MFNISGRIFSISVAVLVGTSSLFAQGSFILGIDDATKRGSVAYSVGPFSGVTISESEPNSDFGTADTMAVGDDFAGEIRTFSDVDYVAFTVAAGDSIQAETVDTGGIVNTELYLYDTDGITQLDYDDNDGSGYFSLISYTFGGAGTYYLAVHPGGSFTGTYSLEVRTTTYDALSPAWRYIRQVTEAVAPGVTRAGADGSVAVLGAADSTAKSDDAGAAYHFCVPLAAANCSLSGTVTFHDTAAAMQTFFNDLGTGAVNPSIIVFPGSFTSNDLDAAESAVLVTNATAIGAYLSSGGGLIAHGESSSSTVGCYDWLPSVFSGAAVTQHAFASFSLTNEGQFLLPAMDDNFYITGGGYFTGHGLDVYMTGGFDITTGPWSGVTVAEIEANDDYTTANSMAIGDDATGSIDAAGTDEDYLSFTAGAGDFTRLETVPVGGVDTTLTLYDIDGTTVLEFDDDGALPTGMSKIDYTLPAAGTYYVAVGSFFVYTGAWSLQTRTLSRGPDHEAIIGSLPSAWNWLGNDLAGVAGEPLAIPTGTLQAGSPCTLSLTDAAPNSTAFLVVGFSTIYANIKGGVLVPAAHAVIPLPTNASGELSFGTNLGAPPSGANFYIQYWILDAAGPCGFSASNAFSGTIP